MENLTQGILGSIKENKFGITTADFITGVSNKCSQSGLWAQTYSNLLLNLPFQSLSPLILNSLSKPDLETSQ